MANTVAVKALTIRQPWAWAIIHGGKDIENRSWNTHHRGPLVIHAGKALERESLEACGELACRKMPAEFDRGYLIGVVDVVDCVNRHKSPWFIGDYGFVLARPRAFKTPIAFTGRLGLFEVRLPSHVIDSATPVRVSR